MSEERVVSLSELAKRCAATTGFTDEKCAEVIENVFSTIGRKLGEGGPIYIEDFAAFGPVQKSRPNFTYKMGGLNPNRWFRPLRLLLEKVNSVTAPAPEVAPKPRQLPINPLRDEDVAIIERWLVDRRRPEEVNSAVELLWVDPKHRKVWADDTITQAKTYMRHFARRSPTPLLQVGLTGMPTPFGDPLRAEVSLYAADYAERAAPRLAKRLPSQYDKGRPDLIWRMSQWILFTHYARDFYRWCEHRALRPPGTNPVEGIRIRSSLSSGSGNFNPVIVVLSWYKELLRYEHFKKPRDKAMVFLLANGLRRAEVARIKMEHIELKEGRLLVLGKGDQPRYVYLLPWTKTAIDGYLQDRAMSADAMSPWLFPSRHPRGRITKFAVWKAVVRVARQVFPKPDQLRIREGIRPHGFRYFYNSMRLNRGTPEMMLRKDIGHRTQLMTARYYRTDEESMKKDVQRVSRKPWF